MNIVSIGYECRVEALGSGIVYVRLINVLNKTKAILYASTKQYSYQPVSKTKPMSNTAQFNPKNLHISIKGSPVDGDDTGRFSRVSPIFTSLDECFLDLMEYCNSQGRKNMANKLTKFFIVNSENIKDIVDSGVGIMDETIDLYPANTINGNGKFNTYELEKAIMILEEGRKTLANSVDDTLVQKLQKLQKSPGLL